MSLHKRIRDRDLHPALLRREIRARDFAYAAFLTCGAVLAGALVLNWIPTGSWPYLALATVYRLPILALFTAAALLGCGLAIRVWREWQIPGLATLTILVPLAPAAAARWPEIVGAGRLYLTAYALLAVGLPLRWLLIDRRRLLERYPPGSADERFGRRR